MTENAGGLLPGTDEGVKTFYWTVTVALLVVVAIEGVLWTLTRIFILNFDVAGPNATAFLFLLLTTGWSLWAVSRLPVGDRSVASIAAGLLVAGFLATLAASPLLAGLGAVVMVTALTPPLAGFVAAQGKRAVSGVALGVLLAAALRVVLGTTAPYATTAGTALLATVVAVAAGSLLALAVTDRLPATDWSAPGGGPAVVWALLLAGAGFLAHPQAVARWAPRSYEFSVLALVVGVGLGLVVLHRVGVPAGRPLAGWVAGYLGAVVVVLSLSHPATLAAFGLAWASALVLVAAGCGTDGGTGREADATESVGAGGDKSEGTSGLGSEKPTGGIGALVGVQFLALVVLALTVAATHWAFFPAPLGQLQGWGTPLTVVFLAILPLAVLGVRFQRGPGTPGTVSQSRRTALSTLAAGVVPLGYLGGTPSTSIRPRPPGRGDTIRVMTYNLHLFFEEHAAGRYSLTAIRDVIDDANPDVVAVCESDGLRPLPGYVDGLRWLGRELGYHTEFGVASRERSYGVGLLSRWPIEDVEVLELPIGRSLTRIAVTATVQTPDGPLPVLSTHFMVEKEVESDDTRAEQAEAVVDAMADQERAVVLGDFNITPDEPEYDILAQAFTDAWLAAAQREGTDATSTAVDPQKRIDYVFLKGGWEVSRAATVGDGDASDHRAVVADIEPGGE